MIGLALVTLVATLGEGLRTSSREALDRQVKAGYVVGHSNGFDTIPAAAGEALTKVPGAEVYPVRYGPRAPARQERVRRRRRARRPTPCSRWSKVPGPGEVLVESGFADENDLEVGSTLEITSPDGRKLGVEVAGLQTRTPTREARLRLLGKVVISQADFDKTFPRPGDLYVFVDGDPDLEALRTAVEPFPDVEADTRATWVTDRVEGINQLLGLLYVLLALSVIVSLFGMVNTLVLTVFERTREIGMLRAVGMSRRQVRRMVRQESVITALIGAALGLPLGLLLAAPDGEGARVRGDDVRPPGRLADHVHDRRGHRRHPRRHRPGAAGRPPRRPQGAAVRVSGAR